MIIIDIKVEDVEEKDNQWLSFFSKIINDMISKKGLTNKKYFYTMFLS